MKLYKKEAITLWQKFKLPAKCYGCGRTDTIYVIEDEKDLWCEDCAKEILLEIDDPSDQ